MYKLRTVILEDDDSKRNWLVKKLKLFAELDIVGEAATLDESFHLLATVKPDAAFIDIQLIGGDVFALFKRLQENGLAIPHSVVTTGYPDYLMSALNDHHRFVVQYLMKPFVADWQNKLRKSIDALIAARLAGTVPTAELPGTEKAQSIFINNRGNLDRLDFDKIAYLEAAGGGETYVVTDTDTHQIDLTLNKFLELLPVERFQRISKTNIVNSARILRINREERTVDIEQGVRFKSLGVGDAFYSEMMKKLPVARDFTSKAVVAKESWESPLSQQGEDTGDRQKLYIENSSLIFEIQETESLLRNIMPAAIAEELKQTGRVTPKNFDLVTVMYCNVQGLSCLTDNMPTEELVKNLDFCFRHFDQVMEKYHIEKIKTFGDYYVCAGGLPTPDTDNPLRVVQAAVDILQFLKEFKMDRERQNLPCFEASIGIHSGRVVAGVVGQLKFAYDIWGDTVNTAARIEQMGAAGQINLSADTYMHVKRHGAFRCVGTVMTDNKEEVEVYAMEG